LTLKSNKLNALLQSCRPRQWTKNLLVVAAPIFSFQLNETIFFNTFIALICFCLISSSIYLLNDSLDVNQDRLHPIKKYRPIASGQISISYARFCSILFLLTSFLISLNISKLLFLILILYTVIQIAYCIKLKNKPIFDLLCISSGFLLRSIAGGVASILDISPWFLLTVGLLAFFLAVEKRKAEILQYQESGKLTRKVLKRYSLPLLLRMESLSSTSAFISYALWSSGPTVQGASTSWMLLTTPFVLFGIFRYQLLSDPAEINRNKLKDLTFTTQNPEEILLKDKGIKLTVVFWLITSFFILLSN
tara:strand:- start:3365 stop:4282 length:918 start_codon:yes stop_codon:yes gene_type:complete